MKRMMLSAVLAAAMLAAISCGKGGAPGSSGEGGTSGSGTTPAAESARIEWGVDTVWCDASETSPDGTKRDLLLTLLPNGTATLNTAYAGGKSGSDPGWWSVRNDTLAVQLATKDGRASGTTTTWTRAGADLKPLVWNREEWGEAGVAFRLRVGGGGS